MNIFDFFVFILFTFLDGSIFVSSTTLSSSFDDNSSDGSSTISSSSDFSIKNCLDPKAFTLVYNSLQHYDQIIESNGNAAFAVNFAEIKSNYPAVLGIKNSNGEQTLILKNKLKFLRNLNDGNLVEAVREIVSSFNEITKMDLQYVMLPLGTPENVVNVFNDMNIACISKSRNIRSIARISALDFAGIILLDTKTGNIRKEHHFILNRQIRNANISVTPLCKCIPLRDIAPVVEVTDAVEIKAESGSTLEFELNQSDHAEYLQEIGLADDIKRHELTDTIEDQVNEAITLKKSAEIKLDEAFELEHKHNDEIKCTRRTKLENYIKESDSRAASKNLVILLLDDSVKRSVSLLILIVLMNFVLYYLSNNLFKSRI